MSKEASFNTDNILLLEQALLKAPQEQLKRNLRSTQRHLERDFTALNTTLAELSKSSPDQTQGTKAVDGMLTRMRGLKRKLSDLNTQSNTALTGVEARVSHIAALNELESFSSTSGYPAWASKRLSRQIVDYLLRRGFLDSSSSLAKSQDVEALVDTDLFRDCARIEKALKEEKVAEALTWCKENQSALKKAKSTLEFDLRYQEFIELIRAGSMPEAIAHSRKYLVPWGGSHLQQIKQAMVLLAFGSDTTCPPYQKLFSSSRWADLATKFRYSLLSVHSLSPLPMLTLSLQTGLAALKTPTCFSAESHAHNPNCPTCAPLLQPLAQSRQVPWSHHANSTIVCKITGKVMEGQDEGRTPWVLPNGRVYSKEGLELLVSQNEKDGMVRCPRTGDEFEFSEAKKVFIS